MPRRILLSFAAAFAIALAVWWRAAVCRSTAESRRSVVNPALTEEGHREAVADAAFARLRRVLPSVTTPVSDWSQFKPESIAVSPYPDVPLTFHAVRITEENRITTWIGRNGLPGASLVGIGKRDSCIGSICK